jgi:hypothetical protein
MFEKYNAVLRFFSIKKLEYNDGEAIPFLQKKCEQLHLGAWIVSHGVQSWEWQNRYETTIHGINSLIVKCGKLAQMMTVYRGFTDATLPKSFFALDRLGFRGGVEFGFMSTTSDRAQAMHYAEGKASTVFELTMGMSDRGAAVEWLSQCA